MVRYALVFALMCVLLVKLLDGTLTPGAPVARNASDSRPGAEATSSAPDDDWQSPEPTGPGPDGPPPDWLEDDFDEPYLHHLTDTVRVQMADNGHFYADILLNRREVHVLIDTGASVLALRDSDAEAVGLYPRPADFSYPVNTANGQTFAALMHVDEAELGDLVIRDVEVFVLPDENLAISLLGMNVLSRMGKIQFDANELVIERRR